VWFLLLTTCTHDDPATDSVAPLPTTQTDTATTDTGGKLRTTTWAFGDDTVTVEILNADHPFRIYTLTTTHSPLDNGPFTRLIGEDHGVPALRSGHDLLDALFALAVWEANENSVNTVRDGSFNGGEPVDCRCFETGDKWPWVWTRDTAYATELGLAWLDPERAWASLDFKLSEHKDSVGGGLLQIVQDTGSGGSWPVSTDRVAWALGADRTLGFMTQARRAELLPRAYEALANTLVIHRRYVWDATDGLYRGEQSFLDWREQTYATRTATDVVPIAASKALSTNALHLEALAIAASWATELGEDPAEWIAQADELRIALGAFQADGAISSVLGGPLDPAPSAQTDALGLTLFARSALPDARAAALDELRFATGGPAVIWPQQPFTPIYHNRAAWPFVTAYVALAQRQQANSTGFRAAFDALVRGAALNLSHMENFELFTGANYLADGEYSGPVVNSRRQLWSVAGFLALVVDGLAGLALVDGEPTLTPFIPPSLLEDGLGDSLTLLRFPLHGESVDLAVDLSGYSAGPDSDRITDVVDDGDPDTLFAPVEPTLAGPELVDGQLSLTLGDGGEDGVVLDVYRDGVRVAQDLAPGSWTDPDTDPDTEGPCYAVRSRHEASGLGSQHPAAACWWGTDHSRIQELDATSFTAVGGTLVDNHGRWHHQDWGEPDHSLSVTFTASASGEHWLQAVYGNGAGPISTGITAATKWLQLTDPSGTVVAEGPLVMPQTGAWDTWADSTVVPASLTAGVSYTIAITDGTNMSWLAHHTLYDEAGGQDEPYGYVNIAALKVLAREG